MGNDRIQNKCEDCGGLFDDDELRHETVSDPFCTGDSWYTETEVFCPNPKCNSDALEVVHMCSTCGEFETLDGFDDCQTCVAELEAQENANL